MSLYPLTGKLLELAAMLDTDNSDVVEAIQNTMAGVEGEFDDRADAILKVRQNIIGEIAGIDAEIERLSEIKRIKNNSAKAIGDYLARNMEAAERYTIKRPLFTLSLAQSPEKVVVDDADAIPLDIEDGNLVRTKVTCDADKKAIAAYLKKLREHNQAVQARIDAGEDCADELKPMPAWARLERGPRVLKIK